jgi:hypothetical protein
VERQLDFEQLAPYRQGDADDQRQGRQLLSQGSVRELHYEMAGAAAVSRFRVTLEQVIEDQEPNAEITTGLTYRRMTKRDPNDFAAKVFRLLREES